MSRKTRGTGGGEQGAQRVLIPIPFSHDYSCSLFLPGFSTGYAAAVYFFSLILSGRWDFSPYPHP